MPIFTFVIICYFQQPWDLEHIAKYHPWIKDDVIYVPLYGYKCLTCMNALGSTTRGAGDTQFIINKNGMDWCNRHPETRYLR